jgi:acyl-CoA-dependent ceramide synthase
MLKYLGFGSICDYAFGLFMAVWVIARHVFYNMTCWSLHVDTPTELPSACYYSDTGAMIAPGDPGYEPDGGSLVWKNILQTYLNPKGPVCWNTPVRWSFLGLLIALQVITLIWFAMIVRVAWKVVNGQPADDERSGDEGEKEEEDLEVEEHTNPKAKPLLPAKAKAKANTEGVPVEEEVGVESLTFVRRTNPGVLTYKRSSTGRGGTSRASGISIPGHGDRKELLGRIGCDKPT